MNTEELKKYDFIVLVDKSGSMSTTDCQGGKSRWDFAKENTLAIARKCQEFDDNGITVGVFSNKLKLYENVTDGSGLLEKIFKENEPSGGTNTAGALKQVIDEYLTANASGNAKPIVVVVMTDGLPDDENALTNLIVDTTKKLQNREQIGLEFIQVGKDEHAKAFLDRLDNGLTSAGATLDIVNTVNCEDLGDQLISDVLIKSLTE